MFYRENNTFVVGFLAGLVSAHWTSIASGTYSLLNLWCKRRPIQIKKIVSAPKPVWKDDDSEHSSQHSEQENKNYFLNGENVEQ